MNDFTQCSSYGSTEEHYSGDIADTSNVLDDMISASLITRENTFDLSFNISGNIINTLNTSELMTEKLNTYENLFDTSKNILDFAMNERSTSSLSNVISVHSIDGENSISNPNNFSLEYDENLEACDTKPTENEVC